MDDFQKLKREAFDAQDRGQPIIISRFGALGVLAAHDADVEHFDKDVKPGADGQYDLASVFYHLGYA